MSTCQAVLAGWGPRRGERCGARVPTCQGCGKAVRYCRIHAHRTADRIPANWRSEKARAQRKARYARLRESGSCQDCGAEAYPGRTRCTPCGRRNAATQGSRR
jgi:hypothetical protein